MPLRANPDASTFLGERLNHCSLSASRNCIELVVLYDVTRSFTKMPCLSTDVPKTPDSGSVILRPNSVRGGWGVSSSEAVFTPDYA